MIEILEKYNFWRNPPGEIGYFRKHYIELFSRYIGNTLIKVISGQRRVGKSYLFRMFINWLIVQKNIPLKNIFYLNKDIYELDFINTSEKLQSAIQSYMNHLKPEGTIYLFLDEIQEIKGWEKVVNAFSQSYIDRYEIFITGSNANLLSTELSTYLTGRYLLFQVFPFSYSEYLGINNLNRHKLSYIDYLKHGGMPETYALHDLEIKQNYYQNLRDAILLKDVVKRYQIRDVNLLEKLVMFIIDSIGSYLSVNKIVKHLKTHHYKATHETIGAYLTCLKDAYFIHESERYEIKGKKILTGERKYYLNDLGFKYYLTSSFDFGIGKYLENMVYLQLLSSGYKVYTGKIAGKEIDFIAEKDNEKKYIQVAYILSDDRVIQREFGNLELIPDNYEKVVVSLDDIQMGNKNGIKHINAWTFC
jgi:hypothetical protein